MAGMADLTTLYRGEPTPFSWLEKNSRLLNRWRGKATGIFYSEILGRLLASWFCTDQG